MDFAVLNDEASAELEALTSMYETDLRPAIGIEMTTDLSLIITSCDSTTPIIGTKASGKKKTATKIAASAGYVPEVPMALRFVMNFYSRTGGNHFTSFVTAQILFGIPRLYPHEWPRVKILRTSGLSDDGKGLAASISEFLRNSILGEPIVMLLVEHIFTVLDEANYGECLICNDTLVLPDARGDVDLSRAFRSSCFHCFHFECLGRWGATVYLASLESKSAQGLRNKDDAAVRSLEGDLKSVLDAKRALEEEIRRIDAEMEAISIEIAIAATSAHTETQMKAPVAKTSTVAPGKRKPGGKAGDSVGKKAQGKGALATDPEPSSISSSARAGDLLPLPSSEQSPSPSLPPNPPGLRPASSTAEGEAAAARQRQVALERLKETQAVALEKLSKVKKRESAIAASLAQARSALSDKRSKELEYPHGQGVVCPFCTSVISCSDPPKVAEALRRALNTAMASLLPSSSEDTGHGASKAPPDHKPPFPCGSTMKTEVSVASLPRDLQELVRRIQEQQISIRARMKNNSGDF